MNKGLVITGLAFIISVVLIASVNYLIIGNQNKNRANVVKMKIDAVTNRNQDVKWIINDTVEEGISQGDNCTDAAQTIETNLQQAMEDNLADIGTVNVDPSSLNTYENNCPQNFTVSADYTIETDDNQIHTEKTFSKIYIY